MSRRRQKKATERAEAARSASAMLASGQIAARRAATARAARLHSDTAEFQADAAAHADTLIELDQQIEGDQLDD